jgi:DNA primase small subunit
MSHQELSSKTKNIIKGLFKEYYKKTDLRVPEDFILREFAFQTFDSESYIRHKSFNNPSTLKEYITSITPKHAYFSSALYREPGAENMDEKGWLGSDLIFDIDANEIPGCNPMKISVCLDSGCDDVELINDECLELAKEHEEELVEVLINDLGFKHDEIEVQFSGNRGFHTRVHPKDQSWLSLDSSARREIVDYLRGVDLDLRYVVLVSSKSKKIRLSLPRTDEGGWRRRLAKKLIDTNVEDLKNKLNEIISRCVVRVDEKVTIDTSRLIRIQESLNGKTGLRVVKLDVKDLQDFKLREDLSPFTNYTALIIPTTDVNNINILGYELSLMKGMSYKVPASVAIYLALSKLTYISKVI